VRRQLGVVIQKPHVFGSTIRANIALADPEIPLARIKDAAIRACIDEDISKMPMQYDTPRRRRRRVAVGRAAPAHRARAGAGGKPGDRAPRRGDERARLDHRDRRAAPARRAAVHAHLHRHRLSTVVGCDRILVMERGPPRRAGQPPRAHRPRRRLRAARRGGKWAARAAGPATTEPRSARATAGAATTADARRSAAANRRSCSSAIAARRGAREFPVQALEAAGGGMPYYDPDAPTWHAQATDSPKKTAATPSGMWRTR